jgi:hypothetical protein
MRKCLFFLVAFSILLLASCQKPVYHYLDDSTKYVFNVHDTLIYKSTLTNDTFLIKFKRYSFDNFDKIYNYQTFEVIFQPLTKIASTDSIIDDKYPILSISRIAPKYAQIVYGSFTCDIFDTDSVISYTIGSHTIPYVYKKNANKNTMDYPVPIKTMYYNHNYGVIAYIKSDDTKFELIEKYFK